MVLTERGSVVSYAGVPEVVRAVTGAIGAGADEEKDPSLRARLLDRMRATPAGGAAVDYTIWARTVASPSSADRSL